MADDLQTEIHDMLNHHSQWGGHDFNVAQGLLWLGILASGFGSLAAGGVISLPRPLSAAIAAIPGLVLLLDKTFKHSARSSWHAMYGARLRILNRRLRDEQANPADVSSELGRLEIEMENLFPPLDPGLLRKREP
jgi:hypothetical protein